MHIQKLFVVLCLLLSVHLNAQNSEDFFRTVPNTSDTDPIWVQQMYSENPHVPTVVDEYHKYYKNRDLVKTTHSQNFKYWIQLVDQYLSEDGYIVLPDPKDEQDIFDDLKEKYNARESVLRIAGAENEWISMGPFETFKQNTTQAISWHSNIYAFDQSKSNPDIVVAGTESGGVYKSIDKGLNWILITKSEVFAGGNGAIGIHPTNPDIILVASNSRIYKTIDGGSTWTEEHYTGGGGNEFSYHPSAPDTVFHSSSQGLFRSNDAGSSWIQLYTDYVYDVNFHPTDHDTVFILKRNTTLVRAEIFRSDDGGATWTIKDNGYYSPSDPANAGVGGGKIGISSAAPDLIYVALIGESKAADVGWIGVYTSEDAGETWTNPLGQDGAPYAAENTDSVWNVAAYSPYGYHQGYYNFDLEVSETEPGRIWIATVRLTESTDSAKTFRSIGGDASTRLSDIHADVQDLVVNGNDVWVLSDGGINYSSDELATHTARNKGVYAADFWGFGTGWNEDSYTGGKYHDGTTGWYEGYDLGEVYNIGGVEEPSGYIHPIESRKMIFRTHYASSESRVRTLPTNFGDNIVSHTNYPIRPNESYFVGRTSGFFFDPRYADHIYTCLDSTIFKSTDGGVNFDALHSFQNGALVYDLKISRVDPDVMYCTMNPDGGYWTYCLMYKSIDGGSTWTQITTPPVHGRRLVFTINPADHDNVWVSSQQASNSDKVYQSLDGGLTWLNRSHSVLDGEAPTDILYQGGTDDLVYLATRNGVFHYDKVAGAWVNYSLNLPLITKSFYLHPFYRDGELRLASSGRGVYARAMADTSFLPLAQPITYRDTSYCSRDTFKFDCYSILNHSGASWSWSFNPAPSYISDASSRNPLVVFGSDGSFDVTLSVLDGNGNSSSKTIADMVTIDSYCAPDSLPSLALEIAADGDRFTAQEVNLKNVTNFTISAWIKPADSVQGFGGIVSNGVWCAHCDNDAVGLISDYFGEELWYKWPGHTDNWYGYSGLYYKYDEWQHVAVTISPDTVTLYLDDEKNVRPMATSLLPADIQDLYLGFGPYSGELMGSIDEVSIWNRTLSESEIRDLRHLTKDDLVGIDNSLVHYFQFNELLGDGKTIMDNAGSAHGSLSGGATLGLSTAPVGGGVSERITVNAGGSYDFGNTGLELTFPPTGTYPNGELVVSRINIQPDSIPNSNQMLDHYWIVNNYGSNTAFSDLLEMNFTPRNGSPSLEAIADPTLVEMYKRSDNEHLNNWSFECAAANVTPGSNGEFQYDASCNMGSFSQFFLTSNSSANPLLPVELLTYGVELSEKQSALNSWQTATEINLSHYEIEHSLDGVQFENIGWVQPEEANSSSSKTYEFEHLKPEFGVNYYRLKIIDLDNSFAYSNIVSIQLRGNTTGDVAVYPNPLKQDEELTIDLFDEQNGMVMLYGSDGKMLLKQNLTSTLSKLSINSFGKGVYIYSIRTANKIRNGQFVVH